MARFFTTLPMLASLAGLATLFTSPSSCHAAPVDTKVVTSTATRVLSQHAATHSKRDASEPPATFEEIFDVYRYDDAFSYTFSDLHARLPFIWSGGYAEHGDHIYGFALGTEPQIPRFGQPVAGKPFAVQKYANASLLTLDAPQSEWNSFFDFCLQACKDEPACEVVNVLMAKGQCALFDNRAGFCGDNGPVFGKLDDTTDSFYFSLNRLFGIMEPTPELYTYVGPHSLDAKPMKKIPMKEPCDKSYFSVRGDNIAECAKACDSDAKCMGFGYFVDFDKKETQCALYRAIKGASSFTRSGALYIKTEALQCGDENKFFGADFEQDDALNFTGCQPLLGEGDVCGAECENKKSAVFSLNDRNYGCAPGLACLKNAAPGPKTCQKPGNFVEEVERQMQPGEVIIGKALPGAEKRTNTSDMLIFDFASLPWDYAKVVVENCAILCSVADTTRECTAYQVDSATRQCIVSYAQLCVSSLVDGKGSVTVLSMVSVSHRQLEDVDDRAVYIETGFQMLDMYENYHPVIPGKESAGVKFVETPCNANDESTNYTAIALDCIEKCKKLEGCHTVVFQPVENRCVLFSGDKGKVFTTENRPAVATFIDPLKVGCTKKEFYGFLEVGQSNYTKVTYEDGATPDAWEAVKAEREFDAIIGALDEDYSVCREFKPVTFEAKCIPFLKKNQPCVFFQTNEEHFFVFASAYKPSEDGYGDQDWAGCAPGLMCDEVEGGSEDDGPGETTIYYESKCSPF